MGTTAITTAVALYYISCNPGLADKLHDELSRVVSNPDAITHEEIAKLD